MPERAVQGGDDAAAQAHDGALCARCKVLTIDGSGWPADDGPLCQICWEDDCARSFWEEARRREG